MKHCKPARWTRAPLAACVAAAMFGGVATDVSATLTQADKSQAGPRDAQPHAQRQGLETSQLSGMNAAARSNLNADLGSVPDDEEPELPRSGRPVPQSIHQSIPQKPPELSTLQAYNFQLSDSDDSEFEVWRPSNAASTDRSAARASVYDPARLQLLKQKYPERWKKPQGNPRAGAAHKPAAELRAAHNEQARAGQAGKVDAPRKGHDVKYLENLAKPRYRAQSDTRTGQAQHDAAARKVDTRPKWGQRQPVQKQYSKEPYGQKPVLRGADGKGRVAPSAYAQYGAAEKTIAPRVTQEPQKVVSKRLEYLATSTKRYQPDSGIERAYQAPSAYAANYDSAQLKKRGMLDERGRPAPVEQQNARRVTHKPQTVDQKRLEHLAGSKTRYQPGSGIKPAYQAPSAYAANYELAQPKKRGKVDEARLKHLAKSKKRYQAGSGIKPAYQAPSANAAHLELPGAGAVQVVSTSVTANALRITDQHCLSSTHAVHLLRLRADLPQASNPALEFDAPAEPQTLSLREVWHNEIGHETPAVILSPGQARSASGIRKACKPSWDMNQRCIVHFEPALHSVPDLYKGLIKGLIARVDEPTDSNAPYIVVRYEVANDYIGWVADGKPQISAELSGASMDANEMLTEPETTPARVDIKRIGNVELAVYSVPEYWRALRALGSQPVQD